MKTPKYYQSLRAQDKSDITEPNVLFKEACREGDIEQLVIVLSKFSFEEIISNAGDAEQIILAISQACC